MLVVTVDILEIVGRESYAAWWSETLPLVYDNKIWHFQNAIAQVG